MFSPQDIRSIETRRIVAETPVWHVASRAIQVVEDADAETRIVGASGPGGRGLTVEQHLARVLACLRVELDAPAP